ncbi:MAG: hypothetical protein ACRDRH_03570 [Pseudonocardia sp.]
MNGYRPVRVAGDELIHYADTDAPHTIGCEQPITTEPPMTGGEGGDAAGGQGQPRCGRCVVEWMAATGQVRLVRRLPTFLPPEVAADHRPAAP